MPSSCHHRRAVAPALLLVLTLLALVTTACSGGSNEHAAASTTSPSTAAPTTTVPGNGAVFPLTGKPVDDAAHAHRPALVVKIDNAPTARPQAGLDAADLVYEEVVEGGVTRFLAVFHSHDAPLVGPVRSVRPIDPAIVTPLGGLFAYSGGAPKFQALIRKAPVHLVGFDEATAAYHRERGRKAPSNLMTSTGALWARAEGEDPPPPLFQYVAPTDPPALLPGERPIAGMRVALGERTSADWAWDPGKKVWSRATNGTPHVTTTGEQLGFENVVLQSTRYRVTNDRDVAGFKVPSADISGSGTALVLTGGRLVPGHWSKPSPSSPTVLTDDAGAPLRLTPGRTWIEFMPTGAVTTPR